MPQKTHPTISGINPANHCPRFRARYSESFEYRPAFTPWLAVNHRPNVREAGHAMWRRIRLIPFEVTIPEDRRDPGLREKLKGEAPGILAWAVAGAVDYLRDGVTAPNAVMAATREYQAAEDVVGRFLDDRVVIDPTATVSKKSLYAAFVAWSEENGEYVYSQRKLNARLTEMNVTDRRGTGGTREWECLRLTNE